MVHKICLIILTALLLILGAYIVKWNYFHYYPPKVIPVVSTGVITNKYNEIGECNSSYSSCTHYYLILDKGVERPVTPATYMNNEVGDTITLEDYSHSKQTFYSNVNFFTTYLLFWFFIILLIVPVIIHYSKKEK
jgi:hypothetical protein